MSHAAIIDLRPMRAQRAVSDSCEIQSLRADQHDIVFYEGDAAGRYFKLIDGAMMLFRLLPDGRRQIVELLGPGDYFGLTLADVAFVRRGRIPKTTSGKVQRRELRARYLNAELERIDTPL